MFFLHYSDHLQILELNYFIIQSNSLHHSFEEEPCKIQGKWQRIYLVIPTEKQWLLDYEYSKEFHL